MSKARKLSIVYAQQSAGERVRVIMPDGRDLLDLIDIDGLTVIMDTGKNGKTTATVKITAPADPVHYEG